MLMQYFPYVLKYWIFIISVNPNGAQYGFLIRSLFGRWRQNGNSSLPDSTLYISFFFWILVDGLLVLLNIIPAENIWSSLIWNSPFFHVACIVQVVQTCTAMYLPLKSVTQSKVFLSNGPYDMELFPRLSLPGKKTSFLFLEDNFSG